MLAIKIDGILKINLKRNNNKINENLKKKN